MCSSDLVVTKITEWIAKNGTPELIISGGASGVDALAEDYAVMMGIPFQKFLPDWDRYGKAAGPSEESTNY